MTRSSYPARGTVDEFGVPDTILGPHPEEVFSGIGRAVALSALFEERLRAPLQALRRKDQTAFAKLRASELVAELGTATATLCAEDLDWVGFPKFLGRATQAFLYRNVLVHSLWPAQDDGSLFGHRTNQKTGERLMTTTSMGEVRGAISELVNLTEEWRVWFAYVGSRASNRLRPASA